MLNGRFWLSKTISNGNQSWSSNTLTDRFREFMLKEEEEQAKLQQTQKR